MHHTTVILIDYVQASTQFLSRAFALINVTMLIGLRAHARAQRLGAYHFNVPRRHFSQQLPQRPTLFI